MMEGETVKDLKVVYALIQNQERKVLLVNNTDGGVVITRRKGKKGETLVEALKREVMEETGLNAKIGDIVSINEGKSTQMNVHTLFIMFKASIQNEVIDIQMKDEISETKWMTIEEADQNLHIIITV